jgi:hypothetical protein
MGKRSALQSVQETERNNLLENEYNEMLQRRRDLLADIAQRAEQATRRSQAFLGGSYEFLRFMIGGAGPATPTQRDAPTKADFEKMVRSTRPVEKIMQDMLDLLRERLPKTAEVPTV